MNNQLIKSIFAKALPAVAAYLVGSGILDQATADQIPAVVDAVIVIAAFVPTAIRSVKNYGKV